MLTAMTLLLGLIGYALLCWVKPFAPCRRCRGLGQIERFRMAAHSSSGRRA